MANITLTEDQVLLLKAAWEYNMEGEDFPDMMQEALEEDDADKIEERINEMTNLILKIK